MSIRVWGMRNGKTDKNLQHRIMGVSNCVLCVYMGMMYQQIKVMSTKFRLSSKHESHKSTAIPDIKIKLLPKIPFLPKRRLHMGI